MNDMKTVLENTRAYLEELQQQRQAKLVSPAEWQQVLDDRKLLEAIVSLLAVERDASAGNGGGSWRSHVLERLTNKGDA